MVKEDMRRCISRLSQWVHEGSSEVVIDLVKKEDTFPQLPQRYS
jgi:hypothetical protein